MFATRIGSRLPIRRGVSCIGMSAGSLLYAGIVTVLVERTAAGQETRVWGSLLATAVTLLG
jgi:crotonobetainyl-CoA:carnitine CoA-transferase CaiB-like acyl-CoA transferase